MTIRVVIDFVMGILSNLLFLSIVFSEKFRRYIVKRYNKFIQRFIKLGISKESSNTLMCIIIGIVLLIILVAYDRLIYDKIKLVM